MITEPIRLEDVPSVMSEKELPQTILVPNPGNRRVVITPEESGYDEEQVFTSKDFPNEIPYKILERRKSSEESFYPRYMSNVVTDKELWIAGEKGCKNGISIIDKIAWGLIWQKKTLEVESIKESDLKFFDYKREWLLYWLAPSKEHSEGINNYSWPGFVDEGHVGYGKSLLFYSNGSWRTSRAAIRPVITLTTIIL